MKSHVLFAKYYILFAGTIIVTAYLIILAVRLNNLRTHKRRDIFLSRYAPYLLYIKLFLGHQEDLLPPQHKLTKQDLLFLQQELAALMLNMKGRCFEQLQALLRQLGLVQMNQQQLASLFPHVRLKSAYYLGIMRVQEAVPQLLSLLRQYRTNQPMIFVVARAAARATQNKEQLHTVVQHMLSLNKKNYQIILDIITDAQVNYQELLVDYLTSDNQELVKLALIGLWEQANPQMLANAAKLIGSEEKELRIKAVKLLFRYNNTFIVGKIPQLLQDQEWEIRSAAAKAIGQLGLRQFIESLKVAITDKNWWVRYNSAKSLGQLGEPGFIALCQVLATSSDPYSTDIALDTINELLNPPDETTPLKQLMLHHEYKYIYEQLVTNQNNNRLQVTA